MQDGGDSSTNVSSPLQFVVLHHSGIDVPHFDLLFETYAGSMLTTFRFTHWPPNDGDEIIKLRDHRRFYLTYEGPVPGDRGRVDRMADGPAVVEVLGSKIRLELADPLMKLQMDRADDAERWTVSIGS